jgi:hypothetical protein
MVKTTRRQLTRGAIFGLFFTLLLLIGCGRAKPIDPPVYLYNDAVSAEFAAVLKSKLTGGTAYKIAPTGSMSPLLVGGEFISTNPTVPLDQTLGKPIAYWPEWKATYEGKLVPVVHRNVAMDRYGAIMEGDSVPHGRNEAKYRVTQKNYIGVVDGIYRVQK